MLEGISAETGVLQTQVAPVEEQQENAVRQNAPKGWGVPDHAKAWGFRRQTDSVSISEEGRALVNGTDDDREKPPKRGTDGITTDDDREKPPKRTGDGIGGLDDDREKPPKRTGDGISGLDDDREKPPKRTGDGIGGLDDDREKPPKRTGDGVAVAAGDPATAPTGGLVVDDDPGGTGEDDREKPPKRRGGDGFGHGGPNPAVSTMETGGMVLDDDPGGTGEDDREKPPKRRGDEVIDFGQAMMTKMVNQYRMFG